MKQLYAVPHTLAVERWKVLASIQKCLLANFKKNLRHDKQSRAIRSIFAEKWPLLAPQNWWRLHSCARHHVRWALRDLCSPSGYHPYVVECRRACTKSNVYGIFTHFSLAFLHSSIKSNISLRTSGSEYAAIHMKMLHFAQQFPAPI